MEQGRCSNFWVDLKCEHADALSRVIGRQHSLLEMSLTKEITQESEVIVAESTELRSVASPSPNTNSSALSSCREALKLSRVERPIQRWLERRDCRCTPHQLNHLTSTSKANVLDKSIQSDRANGSRECANTLDATSDEMYCVQYSI